MMKKSLMKDTASPHPRRLSRHQRWLGLLGVCVLLWLSACASTPVTQASTPSPTPTPDFPLHNAAITTMQTIAAYQQMIDQAQTYGYTVTQDQQQLAQDQLDANSAQTTQAYEALTTRVQGQMTQLNQNMLPAKTDYDLKQLEALIGQTKITNDYEYRDADDALYSLQWQLRHADTTKEYQQIDNKAQILLNNLHALLTNLNDKTPHEQAHATDLQLMNAYQLTGKVVVVSLTEQTLREYDNGVLVGMMYVVTGQPAAQTPPGLWHVSVKKRDATFTSDEKPGDALYYPPTHIYYAMLYREGGYYLHDATWRNYFGPGANMPHDDYRSPGFSNVGSHGCINMNLDNARKLYDWVEIGTAVLVY
jgi:hypothetical protein